MNSNSPEFGEHGIELLGDFVPTVGQAGLMVRDVKPTDWPRAIAVRLNWFLKDGRSEIGDDILVIFYETLLNLTAQWIASGKQGLIETPYKRFVTWTDPPVYPKSVFASLDEFMKRCKLVPEIGRDGRTQLKLKPPLYKKGFRHLKMIDDATSIFSQYLESPAQASLMRCDGCGYFIAREIAPRQQIDRGCFCDKCKGEGRASIKRTEVMRNDRFRELIKLAAKYYPKWSPKKHSQEKSKWVAGMMTPELPPWRTSISGNWVTRHHQQIEEEI